MEDVPEVPNEDDVIKKLYLPSPTQWSHHRAGWKYATDAIVGSLHQFNGTLVYDWYDAVLRDRIETTRPWVGFVHNVISYPQEYQHKYQRLFCLSDIQKAAHWEQNLKNCRGLFTLCEVAAARLRTLTDVPVSAVLHPVADDLPHFTMDGFRSNPRAEIVHVGQWLRKYHAFCDLRCRWRKKMLMPGDVWKKDFEVMDRERPDHGVEVVNHISNGEYDALLSRNIAFLWLYDAAACNTVLECLVRATPLLINRLPALEEYLGVEYPFFYSTMEEACAKADDLGLIPNLRQFAFHPVEQGQRLAHA